MNKLPPKSYPGVDPNKLAPNPLRTVVIEVEDLHRLLIQAYNDGADAAIVSCANAFFRVSPVKKSLPDLTERIAQITTWPPKG